MRTGAERIPLLSGGEPLSLSEVSDFTAVMRVATRKLTLAEMLALHTQPIQIIPAPGANKAIIVVSSVYQNIHGSGSFTSSDSGPGLYYGAVGGGTLNIADGASGASPFVSEDTLFQATSNMTGSNENGGQLGITSIMVNAAVNLANVSANMTGGAGSRGRITVLYYVINTGDV